MIFARPEEKAAPRPAPSQRPGTGTRTIVNSLGSVLSAVPAPRALALCWVPRLNGNGIAFSRGLVEGITPKIGQVKITDNPPPVLELKRDQVNADGESWACLEVEPMPTGALGPLSRVEIVHGNNPFSGDPKVGRQPLAQILWSNGRPTQVIHVTKFNLRFFRILPTNGNGARHLFT